MIRDAHQPWRLQRENRMDEQLNAELGREIRKFQEAMFPKIPKEIVEALLTTTERQVKSGIAAKAKQQGDKAPNFSLRNVRGEPVELAKLLDRGPAVVTFYRGGW
jgi:AhpC/TSA family